MKNDLRFYYRKLIGKLDQTVGDEKHILREYLFALEKEMIGMKRKLEDIFKERNIVAAQKGKEIFSLLEMSDDDIDEYVRWIEVDSEQGHLIYEKSLILLFVAATKSIYPKSEITVEHTINTGLYFRIKNRDFPILKMEHVQKILRKMKEMVEKDIPFEIIDSMSKTDMKKILMQEELDEKLAILEKIDCKKLVTLDNKVFDFAMFKTVPSTGYLEVFDLLYYPPGVILKMPLINDHKTLAPFEERKKLFRVHQEFKGWTEFLDMEYISSLNKKIKNEEFKEMILVSEERHEKEIGNIAEKIASNIDRSRLILIAGPSSSGKTTFSKRLAIHLKVLGLKPVTIGMDDYFLPKDRTPRDENGKYDFESVKAIDIELFNEHLLTLMEGGEIVLPKYNFKKGVREDGEKLKISYNQPIIVEGIHGLNPELTQFIPDNMKFKIYVSALTQLNIDRYNRIKTTNVRLVRRIVRDAQFRGHSAADTIKMWSDVRRGEDKNIFPYQETADIMFNSALPYELCVLRDFGIRFLEQVPEDSNEYIKAKELLFILNLFEPIDPYYTPKSSIIREFVGNSIFEY